VLYSFASGVNHHGLTITNVNGRLMAEEVDLINYFKFFQCSANLDPLDKVMQLAAAWSQSMPENRIDILRFSDGLGMRVEAFILELAYLQDIKHVDITKLTRNELDKIYEGVHKAGKDTVIGKIITKFGNAAANSVSIEIEYGVGMGASIDVGRTKVGGEVTLKSSTTANLSSGITSNLRSFGFGINAGIGFVDVIDFGERFYVDEAPENKFEVTSSVGGSLYFGVGAGGKIRFNWLEFNALLFN